MCTEYYTSSIGWESSGERTSHINSSNASDTDIPALIARGEWQRSDNYIRGICLHLNKWRSIFTSELHKRNSSKQQIMLIRGGGREIDIMVPYNDYNNIMCVCGVGPGVTLASSSTGQRRPSNSSTTGYWWSRLQPSRLLEYCEEERSGGWEQKAMDCIYSGRVPDQDGHWEERESQQPLPTHYQKEWHSISYQQAPGPASQL